MPPSCTSRTHPPTQNRRPEAQEPDGLKIIQHQIGHEHASITGIYQFVSDELPELHPAGCLGPHDGRSPGRSDERPVVRREVEYKWRLSELMAARGLHNTTDLIPLLAERGITLSRPQVYRLVNQKPERVRAAGHRRDL